MNKIYKVEAEKADYIQNYEAIIIAKDKRQVKKIIKEQQIFDKNQGEIFINEININISDVICIANVGA